MFASASASAFASASSSSSLYNHGANDNEKYTSAQIQKFMIIRHINHMSDDDDNFNVIKTLIEVYNLDLPYLEKINCVLTKSNQKVFNYLIDYIAEKNKLLEKEKVEEENKKEEKVEVNEKVNEKVEVNEKDNNDSDEDEDDTNEDEGEFITEKNKQLEEEKVKTNTNPNSQIEQIKEIISAKFVTTMFNYLISKLDEHNTVEDEDCLQLNDSGVSFILEHIDQISFDLMSNEYLNMILAKSWCCILDKRIFDKIVSLKNLKMEKYRIGNMRKSYKHIIELALPTNEDNIISLVMSYFDDSRSKEPKDISNFLEKNNFTNYKELEKQFVESKHFEEKKHRDNFIKIVNKKYVFDKDIIYKQLAKQTYNIMSEFE